MQAVALPVLLSSSSENEFLGQDVYLPNGGGVQWPGQNSLSSTVAFASSLRVQWPQVLQFWASGNAARPKLMQTMCPMLAGPPRLDADGSECDSAVADNRDTDLDSSFKVLTPTVCETNNGITSARRKVLPIKTNFFSLPSKKLRPWSLNLYGLLPYLPRP